MDSNKKNNLIAAGINVDEALERFMNNDGMLNRFLVKFLSDENYNKLLSAADSCSQDEMIMASHSLKGVCGNLAFSVLFELFTKQVQLLRSGDMQAALSLMPEISEEYKKVTSAIRENCM